MKKKTSLSEACRDVLMANARAWRRSTDQILMGDAAEATHAARIAGRRLRAAFKLFAKLLSMRTDRLDRRLANLGAWMGKLRDLDVHRAYVQRVRNTLNGSLGAPLESYDRFLETENRRTRVVLRRRLRSSGPALVREMTVLARGVEKDSPSVVNVAPRLLKKRHEKLREMVKKLHRHAEDAVWHRLRRAVRRFRYAAQFFKGTGSRHLKELIRQLGQQQDLLGERQDRLLGLHLVSAYKAARGEVFSPEERGALLDLVHHLHREKEALEKEILRHWRKSSRHRIKRLLQKSF